MCKGCRVVTVKTQLTNPLPALHRAANKLGHTIDNVTWVTVDVIPKSATLSLAGGAWARVLFLPNGEISLSYDEDFVSFSSRDQLLQRLVIEDNILLAEAQGHTVTEEVLADGSVELIVDTGYEEAYA